MNSFNETSLQAGYVPVRHSGVHRPLFVIQDQHSVEAVFGVIAERNHADLPIYGLSVRALRLPAPRTVEGLAARMLETIRGIQPQGPYRLAGWGQCGLVAYEVATQLVGQDQAVEFIGLVGATVRCDSGVHLPQPSASLPVHLFISAPAGQAAVLHPVGQGAAGSVSGAVAPRLSTDADDSLFPADVPALPWCELLPAAQLRLVHVPGGADGAPSRMLARALGDAVVAASAPAAAAAGAAAAAAGEFAYRPLLTIQTGQRSSTPLFCIPGAGDSVTGFTGLAGALGPAWPLHGLQPRGVEGLLIPHASVEAAAECYLRAIAEIQPHGPVHLVGHSFGGWIAFELACRLRAAQREVASLTLIDSEAPGQCGMAGTVLGGEYDALDVASMFVESLELAAEGSLGVERAALARSHGAARLAQIHGGAVRAGLMPARSQPSVLHGCLRTFGTALRTPYRPAAGYQGPVRLVLIPDTRLDAGANETQYRRMEQGWRAVAPQLVCWHGPGNHMTILRPPHAADLARWWLAGLEQSRHADAPAPEVGAAFA
jgi:thioesterase domain-containing protein